MEYKKQHYVSQFYLKNFTREDNKFTLLNVNKKKVIPSVHYKDQCYENYYYGKDKVWEKILSKLEDKWAGIFNKINKSMLYFPSDEEILEIKKFAIFQRYKTPSNVDNIKKIKWGYGRSIIDMVAIREKINITPNMLNILEKNFHESHSQNIPKEALEMAERLLYSIDDLQVCIINYETKNKLISSDNPIIFYNSFHYRDVGLSNAGIIILFPISPNKLIAIFDSKMYPNLNNRKHINLQNESEVNMLNTFQMIVADEIVYFKDQIQSDRLKNNLEKYKKEKIIYEEQKNTQSFGSENDKIIATHTRHIPLAYTFWFSKPINKALRFKEEEKDWFPRKHTKEYERRMKTRPEILKNIIPRIESKNKVNTKQVERFNNFIEDYWKNSL